MALFTTYNQVGKAESVSDLISLITPSDTPMFSLMKTEKVTARTFSFLEDTLRAGGLNAKAEGSAATMVTLINATERTNNTQILEESFQISRTSDAIKTHGRATETAMQTGKSLKTIKKDLEFSLVGVDQAAVNTNAGTARRMASIINQMSTAVDAGSNSTDALTESKLLTAGQTAYTNGSSPSVLMLKPADSQILASMAAASGRTRELAQTKTLVNVVDLYVSPYGEYKVILNRHLLATHALLIDPTMFKTCVLRPFTRTLLGVDGDRDSHMIVGEYSCKHTNFADSVKITGLS
jgi:hypothetical protein